MTRTHMADPHLVRKLIAGEEDRIRPCVGANYCLDRIYQGGMALCIHNPATGREMAEPHDISPAATPRGFGVPEFQQIGDWIVEIVDALKDTNGDASEGAEQEVKRQVVALCREFPIY